MDRCCGSRTKPFSDSLLKRDARPKFSFVNIVLKTPHHLVERFGLPVPVMVEEVFSFCDKNAIITAKLSDCGYAWVVCGRRLFVWQYHVPISSASPKRIFPICYELKLPQSDLAHRAELVSVFVNKNSRNASCIAVSPEGMVRYWPEVNYDHRSIDEHVKLNGQECDSLVHVDGLGCVFVTTTCTVVLVQYRKGKYAHELDCRTLKIPGGWLEGISRRVSSIFFGPISNDQGTETKIIRLMAIPNIQNTFSIYVLTGLSFQKWQLSDHDPEQMLWTIELIRPIRDSFRAHVNHWDISDYNDVDIWVLDIQPDRDGVLMLCAAVNLHMSHQVYYAMVSFPTHGSNPPGHPKDFLLLKLTSLYKDDNPGDVLTYRFIMSGSNAYVYSSKCITVIKPQEDLDNLEFTHADDNIFNGVMLSGHPLFFSRRFGLVTINSTGLDMTLALAAQTSVLESSLNDQSFANMNLSVYQLNPHEIYTAHRDTAGQLKAAFIFHVKNQFTECYDMVNKLFPSDVPLIPGFDAPLDTAIIKIGQDLLDDIPAGDPRWIHRDSGSDGLGSSHSMLVFHQLVDKQKAFTLYLKFLKESGLWDKLAGVTVRNNQMCTIHLLGELAEKVCAAIVMKSLPPSIPFEHALEQAVKNFKTEVGSGLSKQDVFFREVSRVHEGILWLSKMAEDASHSARTPIDVACCIHEVNKMILTVLTEVVQYRYQQKEYYSLTEVAQSLNLEYLPWTASGGHEGLVDALLLQHSLTVNYGWKVTSQQQMINTLLDDFVLLTDIILDGRKSHLASVKPGGREKVLHKQYCTDRYKLIKPLVDEKSWERTAMLAEKYLDFEILMAICENTNNQDRLNEYMRRFKDTGFPEFVYNWHLRERKQARLIDRYVIVHGNVPEGRERLNKFLTAYPTLNWMLQVYDSKYAEASKTLLSLAENETELVTRQKSMFSLSKLTKLAAPDADDTEEYMEVINKRLEIIAYQEQIPDYVLQQYGYDPLNPPVLQPKDIIALYTCSEYVDSSEVDFKKALDVAKHVADEFERVELILQIWRTALRRDAWDFPNLDSPVDCLQSTLFFRIVDLSIILGADPNTLLPPIDMLIDDPSMEKLNEDKNFQSLLKIGYEHFHRTQLL